MGGKVHVLRLGAGGQGESMGLPAEQFFHEDLRVPDLPPPINQRAV